MKNSEAAHAFGVSLSSVKRYVRLAVEGKPLAPRKRELAPWRRWRRPQGETARRAAPYIRHALYKARPAVSLRQRCEYLMSVGGVALSRSTLCRMIKRLGYTRKKIGGCHRKGRVVESSLDDDFRVSSLQPGSHEPYWSCRHHGGTHLWPIPPAGLEELACSFLHS